MANSLSVLRILLIIPVIYLLLSNQRDLALVFFLVAAVTDVLDGFIARKTHTVTKLGKWLDPIADKLLMVSMLVFFFLKNEMPALGFFVLSRDILVILGGILAIKEIKKRAKPVPPTFLGKTTTFLQVVTIITMIKSPIPSLLFLASTMSFISGIQYLVLYARLGSLESHSVRSLDPGKK